jgi:hypothetical protein
MQFTKNDDRSVTVNGTKEEVQALRDTVAEGWGEDDTLVEEISSIIENDSASTLEVRIEPDTLGELVDVLEAADHREVATLGEDLRAMMDAHNDEAIRAVEGE